MDIFCFLICVFYFGLVWGTSLKYSQFGILKDSWLLAVMAPVVVILCIPLICVKRARKSDVLKRLLLSPLTVLLCFKAFPEITERIVSPASKKIINKFEKNQMFLEKGCSENFFDQLINDTTQNIKLAVMECSKILNRRPLFSKKKPAY